jgi:F0F1-type ATP synthase assembly protein I
MLLFNSVVFGAFVGFLTDYWLSRATVKDPLRLIVAVAVAVIVGVLVYVGHLTAF